MVIIAHRAIREFATKYPELQMPLERWYEITASSDWSNYAEMKRDFNSVDAVGNGLFVFNIKGNCRLIARIIFKTRTVFIRFIGTHKQYDGLTIREL